MAQKNEAISNAPANELAISRILNAPRDLVWEAWTDPKHLAKWWGPNGFTTTTHKIEIKEGGEWDFIMHGPNGADYKNKIVFNRLVKPELITYSNITRPKFDVTVTFKKYGAKTKLNVRMVFDSAKDYDVAVNTFGAKQGLEQHIGRLKEYVEKM